MLIQTTRYTLFLLFKTLYMQWPASKREFTRKRTATRSLLFITLARVTYKMCWRNNRPTSTVLIDGPCSHTDEFRDEILSVAYATRLYRLHTARELRVHRGQFSSHDPRYIQLYCMYTMARLIYTGNSLGHTRQQ